MTLYFAYGSNLHAADFAAYCARYELSIDGMRELGPAWLPDHRLAFTTPSVSRQGGVLDVLPSVGHAVPGGLFRIVDDEAWVTLDHKETVPDMYRRRPAVVLDQGGCAHHVTTYEVVPSRRSPFVTPHHDYVRVVREGLATFGQGDSHLDDAVVDRPQALLPLFVYGSLRRGAPAHQLLARAGARAAGTGAVSGHLVPLGEHVALHLAPAAGERVEGELWAIDAATLLALDEYEGFAGHGAPGSLYQRAVVRVDPPAGASRLAWTYVGALP